MCKAMEEMRRIEREETQKAVAKSMLADKVLPLEQIAKYTELPLEAVKKLKEQLS